MVQGLIWRVYKTPSSTQYLNASSTALFFLNASPTANVIWCIYAGQHRFYCGSSSFRQILPSLFLRRRQGYLQILVQPRRQNALALDKFSHGCTEQLAFRFCDFVDECPSFPFVQNFHDQDSCEVHPGSISASFQASVRPERLEVCFRKGAFC